MTFDPHHRSDPEAPDEDVQEQEETVDAEPDADPEAGAAPREPAPVLRDPEVPEADALEQALDVPYDDEYG
jgi:hypothetical protein